VHFAFYLHGEPAIVDGIRHFQPLNAMGGKITVDPSPPVRDSMFDQIFGLIQRSVASRFLEARTGIRIMQGECHGS